MKQAEEGDGIMMNAAVVYRRRAVIGVVLTVSWDGVENDRS